MTTLYAQDGSNEVMSVHWHDGGGNDAVPASGDTLNLNGQTGISFSNPNAFTSITFEDSGSNTITLTGSAGSCNVTVNYMVAATIGGADLTIASGYTHAYNYGYTDNATYKIIIAGTLEINYGATINDTIEVGSAATYGTLKLNTMCTLNAVSYGAGNGLIRVMSSAATLGLSSVPYGSELQVDYGATLYTDGLTISGTVSAMGVWTDTGTILVSDNGVLDIGSNGVAGQVNALNFTQNSSTATTTLTDGTLAVTGTATLTNGFFTLNAFSTFDHGDGQSFVTSEDCSKTFPVGCVVKFSGHTIPPVIPTTHRMLAYGGLLMPNVVMNYGSGADAGGTVSVDAVLNTVTGGTYVAVTAANVRKSTPFGPSGALSGLAYIPSPSNVRTGINVDQTVGTCAVPTASNVRTGVSVDATVGTCAVPAAGDVQQGVSVDATTGTFLVPPEADVEAGVQYGADGNEFTGELAVADPALLRLTD